MSLTIPAALAAAVLATAPAPAHAPAAPLDADVLVIGGGTGGIAAALQSARLGARTIVAEPLPWLGGMLSSAGVSATDGNHRLPSGIWREFRQKVYDTYGGPEAVNTGWVSNTHFEPHVADRIFKELAAAERHLRVLLRHRLVDVRREGDTVRGAVLEDLATGRRVEVRARVVVDGTDLGDVLARAGAAFDLGLEVDSVSGEKAGVAASSDVVQDLTWCAILKDYGPGADRTIPRPAGYDPVEFDCSSTSYCHDATRQKPGVDAQKMLDYARLPNGKYLLNWPIYGNDTYLNVVALDDAAREKALEAARARTLRFVYFIQHELGLPAPRPRRRRVPDARPAGPLALPPRGPSPARDRPASRPATSRSRSARATRCTAPASRSATTRSTTTTGATRTRRSTCGSCRCRRSRCRSVPSSRRRSTVSWSRTRRSR